MRKERYIIEIEMPDGDAASSMYIHDVIQSDCDIEDEGRWKVSVKEYWEPSEEQIQELGIVATGKGWFSKEILSGLLEQLKKLNGE